MASTNTPGIQYVAGESMGRDNNGKLVSVSYPAIPTKSVAPTGFPGEGSPVVLTLPASGLYVYDGTTWRGPL